MNKNILYIAYYFPPLAGSGVQRTLKFIKYLPNYNKTPIVVTVEEGHNYAHDKELINEVPGCVKVYRSNSGETLWLREKIETVNKYITNIKKRRNDNKSIKAYDNKSEDDKETNKV